MVPLLAMPCGSAEVSLAKLDAAQIGWQRAVFQAKKLFFTARSSVQLSFPSAADFASELAIVEVDEPVWPGKQTVRVNYIADGLGRHTETVLLMNSMTTAAIQYATHEPGHRWRVYRFTEHGAYVKTRRPAKSETKDSSEHWSDHSEAFRPYRDDPQGMPVIDPVGLLYIITAADIDALKDMEFLALNSNTISQIVFSVGEPVQLDVDFLLGGSGDGRRCKGKVSALRIRLNARPFGSEAKADFDFMGLQSDVPVFIDSESHLPLMISGRAKIIGKMKIKLREATLLSGECPEFIGSGVSTGLKTDTPGFIGAGKYSHAVY